MRNRLRVLNLEDDSIDAELNQAMISARWPECDFICAATRDEFLAALEQGGFDVILSDYTMPSFDGRQALALAREKLPSAPFLFVSGTIGEDAAIEALKNGATDYVLKHRLMRLIPAIDRALRETEERKERERAEEAMRQSEHKYRQLFECLGDAAFLADELSGKIIDTNRRAEELLGCTRAQILGRKQSHFLSKGDDASACVFEMICANGSRIRINVLETRLTLYGRQLVLRLCHAPA